MLSSENIASSSVMKYNLKGHICLREITTLEIDTTLMIEREI